VLHVYSAEFWNVTSVVETVAWAITGGDLQFTLTHVWGALKVASFWQMTPYFLLPFGSVSNE
jgi:hypothetical protein